MSAIVPDRLSPRSRPLFRRLRWLFAIGAVLIALAAAYIHFYLYLPQGTGPAGPPVDRAVYEQP